MTKKISAASRAAIERASPIFLRVAAETRLLSALNWPIDVEREFFARGANKLPKVEYAVDRDLARAHVTELEELAMTFDVADPIQGWLAATARSHADSNRLLLAVGTQRFHEISLELYGGPKSSFDDKTTNLDLAEHLVGRVGDEQARTVATTEREADLLAAEDVARVLGKRATEAKLEMEAHVDEDISARMVCGTRRLRVRAGGDFGNWELDGLFAHEVETHALTAQNAEASPQLPFLHVGGPRTTRTQEGLAVFAEFHAHALTLERLRRLARRVRLVAMATEGASFLDLYRHIVDDGMPERDAYFDAQRILRGGLVDGGAPFTKDASYLAGFADVFMFLQVAVRAGARDAVRLLATGRIALEDLPVLDQLREAGLLAKPPREPRWMRSWDALLPFFAFTSFLHELDVGAVAKKHAEILERSAESAHG